MQRQKSLSSQRTPLPKDLDASTVQSLQMEADEPCLIQIVFVFALFSFSLFFMLALCSCLEQELDIQRRHCQGDNDNNTVDKLLLMIVGINRGMFLDW